MRTLSSTLQYPKPRQMSSLFIRPPLAVGSADQFVAGATPLVLAPAAARAGVVPPNPAVRRHASRSFAAPETHNVARRATLAQKGGHGFHVRVNVPEPGLQSGAEIIQSAL